MKSRSVPEAMWVLCGRACIRRQLSEGGRVGQRPASPFCGSGVLKTLGPAGSNYRGSNTSTTGAVAAGVQRARPTGTLSA